MSKDTIQAIEENIRQAREIIELNTSLERLYGNRDFKKVFLDGYFKAEAVRLVHLKAEPQMQTPERQLSVIAQIDAIGGLLEYLRTVAYNASVASKAVETGAADIEELLAEETMNG